MIRVSFRFSRSHFAGGDGFGKDVFRVSFFEQFDLSSFADAGRAEEEEKHGGRGKGMEGTEGGGGLKGSKGLKGLKEGVNGQWSKVNCSRFISSSVHKFFRFTLFSIGEKSFGEK